MKYYKPLAGNISVDGSPIQSLDTGWIRRNITLVQQDGVLFNETMRQNISCGNQDECGIDDIKNACETACLRDTIEDMPDGLDTLVGQAGRSLSGGQKQRVVIARARVRDASVLILDESTRALDHTSRRQVMARIRNWRKGKTTIIITHDMSQILDDDYVYVLDHSRVVQEGYRSKLKHKLQESFSSTLCPTSNMEEDQRARSHEPLGPPYLTDPGEEEDFSQRWQYISRVFNPSTSSTNHMSWGFGVAQANALRSSLIWSNSLTTNSPQMGNSRQQSRISYISPIQTPRVPSPALVEKDANRSSRDPIRSFTDRRYESSPGSRIRSMAPNTSEVNSICPVSPRQSSEQSPNDDIPTPDSENNEKTATVSLAHILGTIWPILNRKGRMIFLFGFLAAFIVAVCTPAFAYVFARLLSVFYLPRNRQASQALKWALCLLGIAIVDGLSCFSMHYALEYCGQSWVTSLRIEALKRILAQPKSWFDDEHNSPGRLNQCLDRDAEEMRNLVGRFAGPVFTVIWMLGISVAFAFIISWKLSLVALACGPLVYIITRIYHMVSSKWEEKCNKRAEHTSSIFTETFANIRVVRAFTLESHLQRKHRIATFDTYKTGLSRALYTGLIYGVPDATQFFITALIFYYGTILITTGSHSVDSIIQAVNLLLFGISNASSMLDMMPQISSSRTTATSMLRLANLPIDSSHETGGMRRLATPLPIEMTNLSFTHPGQPHGTKTLSEISLRINAGTCTAIVGPSGSGKSTIISILQCLYPPNPAPLLNSPAALSFAGVSSENCNVTNIRTHISVVPQTPLLFPSSILANIT